jgi:hypothetical protein
MVTSFISAIMGGRRRPSRLWITRGENVLVVRTKCIPAFMVVVVHKVYSRGAWLCRA